MAHRGPREDEKENVNGAQLDELVACSVQTSSVYPSANDSKVDLHKLRVQEDR